MTASPNIALPYLVAGQAQAEVTANDAFNIIDALLGQGVLDKDVSNPGTLTPSNGDVYIVASGAVGDWSGQVGKVAIYYDGWTFLTPQEGWTLWARDEDRPYTYSGTAWVQTPFRAPSYTVAGLPASPGVGATAFATNGRKVGQGAGTGTGVLVYHDGTAWRACDTSSTVSS